jgi:hypothetical protein
MAALLANGEFPIGVFLDLGGAVKRELSGPAVLVLALYSNVLNVEHAGT